MKAQVTRSWSRTTWEAETWWSELVGIFTQLLSSLETSLSWRRSFLFYFWAETKHSNCLGVAGIYC